MGKLCGFSFAMFDYKRVHATLEKTKELLGTHTF
jgi:hypothetical protein